MSGVGDSDVTATCAPPSGQKSNYNERNAVDRSNPIRSDSVWPPIDFCIYSRDDRQGTITAD